MQGLSIKEPFLVILPDRIICKPDPLYLPKVSSAFHRTRVITLPSFCENPKHEGEKKCHCLDVRRCLLAYLQRLKEFLGDLIIFLISGPRKGLQASKSSVSRWIRQGITIAYKSLGIPAPEKLKAHSTRTLATSWAKKAGASWEQIRSHLVQSRHLPESLQRWRSYRSKT